MKFSSELWIVTAIIWAIQMVMNVYFGHYLIAMNNFFAVFMCAIYYLKLKEA